MVSKRLNKIIDQCQLNWHIIDCVEELSTNFLTNTVQEENINTLIDKINKNSEYDILEDEYEFENLNLEEEDEFTIEFTEIIEERKEILSRLGEILKNAEESSENAEGSSSKLS